MRVQQVNNIRQMTNKGNYYTSPTTTSPPKITTSQWDNNNIQSNESRKDSRSTSQKPIPVRRIRSATNSSLLGKVPNSFAPITSHYALNDTLYQAFYRLLEKKHYPTALSVGLQFCRVALWDIPQHGYYNSPKYHDLKIKSAKNALHVSDVLSGVVVRCAPSIKANGGQELYQEKRKEVELVKSVARDHYHLIVLEDIDISPSKARVNADAVQKRQDAKIDDAHHVGWMDMLDCAEINLNICPYSNPLSSVSEEIDHDNNDAGGREEDDQNIGKDRFDGNKVQRLTPHDEKRHRPKHGPSQIEMSRSSSAPAYLGKSIHSNNHPHAEIREPPPPTTTIFEEDAQLSTIHECTTNEENVMDGESKTEEDLQFESDLERALYLSGLEIQPSYQGTIRDPYIPMTSTQGDGISVLTLTKLYKDDFEELRNNRSIHVSFLDTYQGRVRDSLNGCTVIAPLLAIHHLCDDDTLRQRNDILLQGKEDMDALHRLDTKNFGLHDETIRVVIDVQAAIVAPLVRQRLGLPKDALIIPSDVHDYLIDENFLRQDQFSGVYGGNIMDDEHLTKFIDALSKFGRRQGIDIDTAEPVESRKIAATFFFHEHVISLHRVTKHVITSFEDQGHHPQGATKKRFFTRLGRRKAKKMPNDRNDENIVTLTEEEAWYEIIDSLPGAAMLNRDEDREQIGNHYDFHLKSTARIRCSNTKSLHASLRWYACSKFTPEDQKFIDSYQWNDRNVEFDPRVFQAFVWSD